MTEEERIKKGIVKIQLTVTSRRSWSSERERARERAREREVVLIFAVRR